MAAPFVFRRDWIVGIKGMLFNDDDNNPIPSMATILRVPTALLKMKPEAFIPQLISLGPYHRSKLEKDIDSPSEECMISMAERYKVKSAVMLKQKLLESGKNFKCIVEIMNRRRPEIESFYRLPTSTEGEYSQNFDLMMAIDSSFLLQFLISAKISTLTLNPEMVRFFILTLDPEMERFFRTYAPCIGQDIKKMENQIPLFVLNEVLQYVIEAPVDNKKVSLNDLLPIMCPVFSPFERNNPCLGIAKNERNILIDEEPHLLGYLHSALSQVLRMQSGDETQRKPTGILNKIVIRIHLPTVPGLGILLQKFNDILKSLVKRIGGLLPSVPDTAVHFQKGMSAWELSTAGIKFKCFTKVPDNIRLDKESGTLYLPQILVNETHTEVYLRNMLALEFNDDHRPKYLTHYVALMGILIQSPDDVRILLDSQVICKGPLNLTDESMAQMWYDLRQPFFRASFTPIYTDLNEAFENWFKRSYWRNNIKRNLCEFYNFVLSWKFAGPLAAFLGLLMTAIQTYCSLYHCTR